MNFTTTTDKLFLHIFLKPQVGIIDSRTPTDTASFIN